jgi:hypothetical protein
MPYTLKPWILPTQCICVSPVRYGLLTVYLCVPYGSHNKQRLFPHTALTGWALWRRRDVSPVRYGLLTQCICVFRTVLTANSDCFPTQHIALGVILCRRLYLKRLGKDGHGAP